MTYWESVAASLLWILSIIVMLVAVSVIVWFAWRCLPNQFKRNIRRFFEED